MPCTILVRGTGRPSYRSCSSRASRLIDGGGPVISIQRLSRNRVSSPLHLQQQCLLFPPSFFGTCSSSASPLADLPSLPVQSCNVRNFPEHGHGFLIGECFSGKKEFNEVILFVFSLQLIDQHLFSCQSMFLAWMYYRNLGYELGDLRLCRKRGSP